MNSDDLDKIIYLRGEDDIPIPLTIRAARLSTTISNLLDDLENIDDIIEIGSISSEILVKIATYCSHYSVCPDFDPSDDSPATMNAWDMDFLAVPQVPEQGYFLQKLMEAANYLDMYHLLDMTCKVFAKSICNKSPEEIRELYQLPNDLSPDELLSLDKENIWCYENPNLSSSSSSMSDSSDSD